MAHRSCLHWWPWNTYYLERLHFACPRPVLSCLVVMMDCVNLVSRVVNALTKSMDYTMPVHVGWAFFISHTTHILERAARFDVDGVARDEAI